MTKQRIAQAAAVLVLVVAAGVGVGRKSNWRPPDLAAWRTALLPAEKAEAEPQDAIYAMMNAARTGDVKTYLGNFTGTMLASLRQELGATSEAEFGRYLKEANATVRGVTIFDAERIGETEAKVRVEYVYPDRNEAQTMYLEKSPRGWKISRTDAEERVKTLIPFGTPVK